MHAEPIFATAAQRILPGCLASRFTLGFSGLGTLAYFVKLLPEGLASK